MSTTSTETITEPIENLESAVRISPSTPTPEEEHLVDRWYMMAIHYGSPPMWQRVAAALAQHRIRLTREAR